MQPTPTPARRHRRAPERARAPFLIVAALGALALVPATAGAALTIQPNAPALGFPASTTDAVSGIKLTSCQDTSGFCVETPAPNPAAPLSVPGNYTPDGEGFYFLADATVPNAGIGLARFALEQAFIGPDPVAGDQIMFGRIRFRFGGLKPGTTYRVTHPYGVDEVVADGGGIINETTDLGCLGPPCNFATANYGAVTSFLRWDPTVAPAAPAGYIGNAFVEHKVIGSPVGTNFVRLEELGAGGAVAGVVGETSTFLVQGKLAGAAPAAAPFAIPDSMGLDFASRQTGSATPEKLITLANHGTAPLTVSAATVGGADAGDFQVASNTCTAAVAPAATCAIGVTFTPLATGARNATLALASNSLGAPHTVALKGTGTPVALPAPAPVVIQAPAPAPIVVQAPAAVVKAPNAATALRVAHKWRLRQVRGRGITLTFVASAGASVGKVRLVRIGSRKAVATKLFNIDRAGTQTVHLRARNARAGQYRLDVATGRSDTSLTGPVSALITLRR